MLRWSVAGIVAALLVAALFSYLGTPRPPALSSTEYWGTEITARAAPEIAGLHLSQFKGRPVALTFIDPDCRDTCPMTAAALLSLQHPDLVLIGVNVNPEAEVKDLFGLDRLPNWHFLNGTWAELEPVWRAYGVASLPGHGGRLEHTSGVFLIDREGMLRVYVNDPPRLGEILRKRLKEL